MPTGKSGLSGTVTGLAPFAHRDVTPARQSLPSVNSRIR
jgi:hypothetical protein